MSADAPVNGLRPGVSAAAGTGILGGSSPSPTRKRPDLCASHGHPGVTYHPQMDKTWCLCGEVIRDGNTVEWPKADGPDGPLEEVIS